MSKGELETYWKRFDALTPPNLIKQLYTADVVNCIRKRVRAQSGINFDNDDVLNALHDLITEKYEAVKPKILK